MKSFWFLSCTTSTSLASWQHYTLHKSEDYYWIMVDGFICALTDLQHTIPASKHTFSQGIKSFNLRGGDRERVPLRGFQVIIRDKRISSQFHAGQSVSRTYHAVTCRGRREGVGEGLTIVGVQQGQGPLPAPVHPSLRNDQKRKRRWVHKEEKKLIEKLWGVSKRRQLVEVRKQPKWCRKFRVSAADWA